MSNFSAHGAFARAFRGLPRRTEALAASAWASAWVVTCFALAGAPGANAEYLVQNDDYYVRLNNTLKYSGSVRVAPQSQAVLNRLNVNDGDYAFKQGQLTSNRVDLFSELDAQENSSHHYGLRLSAGAWYDTVYNRSHNAVPADQYNGIAEGVGSFSDTARTLNGKNVMLYDALAHGQWDIDGHNLSLHVGRETVQWGESIFFSNNGIAGGMSPVDGIKASLVPGIQAKEIYLPVGQVSTTFQVNDNITLAGYYQFEYRPTLAPVPGTYTSVADFLYEGSESLRLAPGGPYWSHGKDKKPSNGGQYGLAVRYSDLDLELDTGLYWVHYTAKLPQMYVDLPAGRYRYIYPKGIDAFGVSFAKQILGGSWGLELNVKTNEPLLGNTPFYFAPTTDSSAPLWPTANVAHVNLNNIQIFGEQTLFGAKLWDASSVVAEVAGEHVLQVTGRKDVDRSLYPNTAVVATAIFTPTWYQALPNLDLSMPITISDVLLGPSPTDITFGGTGATRGGFVGIGLSGLYKNTWKIGLNYTSFYGSSKSKNGAQTNQPYIDRDFVSFNLSRTF